MDKKSLKVKIVLNFYGTYKEVRNVADIPTTETIVLFSCLNFVENMILWQNCLKSNSLECQ